MSYADKEAKRLMNEDPGAELLAGAFWREAYTGAR